jgi:hypothetical protein
MAGRRWRTRLLVLLAALQLATATAAAPPPARIDLLAPAAPACPSADADSDVVVCARRNQEQFRLRPLAERDQAALPRAATRLGPGELSATVDQATMPNGEVSRRAMLNFRLPF